MSDIPTRPKPREFPGIKGQMISELNYYFRMDEATPYMDTLEQRNRELEHRPTVASHNALQEECDGRLVVHKRQRAHITELVEALRWLRANGVGPEGNTRIDAMIAKMEATDE